MANKLLPNRDCLLARWVKETHSILSLDKKAPYALVLASNIDGIKEGDKVVFSHFTGFEYEGEEYLSLKESDIIATIG